MRLAVFAGNPVVGDENNGAAKIQQQFFQPLNGRDIQVVGWLIQQQDVRFQHKGVPGQRVATSRPTGSHQGIRGQIQLGDNGLYLVLYFPTILALNLVLQLLKLFSDLGSHGL